MLGRDDSARRAQEDLKLPFGVEKIMNSLIGQLEKQMGSMDFDGEGMPKGIKIRVARGPQANNVAKKKIRMPEISEQESERRIGLPKVEVESKVRRLADTIVYEIETPGVRRNEDVVLTELASGIEIKAYSKDKCYVKFIPLKVEVLGWKVDRDRVMVEIKG